MSGAGCLRGPGACRRASAHQPNPVLSGWQTSAPPSMGDARLDRLVRDLAPVAVEQRQFPASAALVQFEVPIRAWGRRCRNFKSAALASARLVADAPPSLARPALRGAHAVPI